MPDDLAGHRFVVRYSNYVGADMQAIRRASATLLVGAGVDPKTVQARFGHSQIQATMTYYAEVVREARTFKATA